MDFIIGLLNSIGKQAVSQLSGPAGLVAGLVLKFVIWALDYLKVKNDFKKQSEEKLAEYEAALKDPALTEEQKDEARKNFLK
ncbi:MAG: hypothetical protein BWZ03_00261 [bacterium ADurb.BinA186]|nr:MAG: hypothetical protein BWZ03_00261 [bacterium ADurb.BinA186]